MVCLAAAETKYHMLCGLKQQKRVVPAPGPEVRSQGVGGGECCSLRRLWGTSLPSFRGCWRPWACGRISPGSAPAFTWPSPRVVVFPDKYTSRAAWRATLTQQNLISTEFICKTLFPNRHIHGPQGLGLEYTFWGSSQGDRTQPSSVERRPILGASGSRTWRRAVLGHPPAGPEAQKDGASP